MNDNKEPDFIKNLNLKLSDEQKDVIKNFVVNNPVRTYQPYGNVQNENIGIPKDVTDQLEKNFKTKSFRETTLFWVSIASIIIAVVSLIVSIMALKH